MVQKKNTLLVKQYRTSLCVCVFVCVFVAPNHHFYSFNPSMYYSIAITVMEKFHVDIHPRKKEVRF